jgi:transposase-like protein
MAEYTFQEFQAEYPDDAACLARIMEIQYGGDMAECQVCNCKRQFHAMGKRRAFACQVCGHHIYPCAGTIFHKSSTKLSIWFFAMYLMTSTRHGVAAKEVERQTGVTYKCAWRICHELRKLMASADYSGPLTGHVEIDEIVLGGVNKGRGVKRRMENKTVVFGMIEREGKLRAMPIPNTTKSTLEPIVRANVEVGSIISTDENPSYSDLKHGYEHGTVTHRRKEYVRGAHHVNSLEGHWSHFQRAIKGTHVHISGKHAWKYIAEFSYRRNMRHSHSGMFNLLVHAFSLPRIKDA